MSGNTVPDGIVMHPITYRDLLTATKPYYSKEKANKIVLEMVTEGGWDEKKIEKLRDRLK